MSTPNQDEILLQLQDIFKERTALLHEVEFLTKKMIDLNKEIENSQNNKALFMSLIHNVFNNPLGTLLSLAKRLKKETDITRAQKYGGIIHAELLKIDYYLKNIFEVSNIESGQVGSFYASVSPRQKIEEALENLEFIIEEKNLNVVINEEFLKPVISDSNKLYMIALNLLSNALEYSFPESNVTIAIGLTPEKKLLLSFHNTGDQIKLEYKNEIYNRFNKDQNAHRISQGLGIALSVVRAFVELLDGTIDYESTVNGTTFTVLLPIAPLKEEIPVENDDDIFFSDDEFKEF